MTARRGQPERLTDRQLNRTTLLRQSLLKRADLKPAAAIHELAGLQAQHANSPYVALWSRLTRFKVEELEQALDDRSVVKAPTPRNTLHLLAAEDFPAFSVASSVARVANWRASAKRAGLDTADLHGRLLRFAKEPRTVAEMEADLEAVASDASLKEHVPSGVRHVAFLMASSHGWLVHVPPSGKWNEFGKPRYVDASVWLPRAKRPDPDEALRIAVERYLRAYGPASVADVGKWLGQPRLPPIREAIKSLGDRIRPFLGPDDRELWDLANAPIATGDEPARVSFLARWDSVVIGYDVRDRILPRQLAPTVVKKNADILATFLVDGFVAGTWSVSQAGGTTTIELSPVGRVAKADRTPLEEEAEVLAGFMSRGDAAAVRWA